MHLRKADMQITLFTDYGLRSLMYVAERPDALSSVREIAEHYGISRNHMVKVVHRLVQLGYVESVRGKGGGIRLARPANMLPLGMLIEALEQNMNLVECFDPETNTCRIIKSCRLKHHLRDANAAFIASLNQHTLADTLESV